MLRTAAYLAHICFMGVCAIVTAISTAFMPRSAHAGISLSQTRVIFSAEEKDHSLMVKNSGADTYLIQSRVQQTPNDMAAAPFLVTPPLVVIRPDSHQLLRIIPQNLHLPADRESVFYLSVMAIPAQADKQHAPAQLSMGLRFVIKLFYRPVGMAPPAPDALCDLRFHLAGQSVQVENPTPYFHTLGRLAFDHIPHTLDMDAAMIAPRSSRTYPLPHAVTLAEWQVVTDYGGLSTPACHQTLDSRKEAP